MSDRSWEWWKSAGIVVLALVLGNASDAWQAIKDDQAQAATKLDVKELREDIASLRSDKQRLERVISDVGSLDDRQRVMAGMICQLNQIHDKTCAFRNMVWLPGMPYPDPIRVDALRVAYHKSPAVGVHLVTNDAGA